MTDMYHAGNRELQDRFDTRRLADRLEEVKVHDRFTPDDREFVERLDMLFLASADEHGNPTCSYKGGDPGFVRVVGDNTLAFPNYDGNGMYLSMGNVAVNPSVGLLFIDFERQRRMRVDGTATMHADDELLARYPGAQFIVRVARDTFILTVRAISIGISWSSARFSYRGRIARRRSPGGSKPTGQAMCCRQTIPPGYREREKPLAIANAKRHYSKTEDFADFADRHIPPMHSRFREAPQRVPWRKSFPPPVESRVGCFTRFAFR